MSVNDNLKSNNALEDRGVCGPRPSLTQCTYIFKCKPTYNFQSVEFEFAGSIDDIPDMMAIYDRIVKELILIAPDQSQSSFAKKVAPQEEMPTEKMYAIMDRFGIKYTSKTTKKEASELIQKSLDKSN